MWKNLTIVLTALAMPGMVAAACNPNAPETTPTARFVDNGDGTATDTATGLMWKRCTEGYEYVDGADGPFGADGCSVTGATSFTWQGALNQAASVNSGGGYAGHTDWRVANLKELSSIVEVQCWSPAINAAVFPNTPNSFVWSASPSVIRATYAWYVRFDYGYDSDDLKNNGKYVRLVRAGQ